MALTNGSGYTLPTATTCYKSGADGTSSFAYGSEARSISDFQVKYYHNDDLIYTSTASTATVYPMIVNYYQDSNKINALSSDDSQITWTLQSGYTGNPITAMLGADDQYGSADYSNMSYAFQFDGAVTPKLISIKESGNLRLSGIDRTVVNGDKFKLVISSAPVSSGALLPPPIAWVNI